VCEELETMNAPPRFDGPRFAAWLRKVMRHERLTARELGQRAGVHATTIDALLRGIPPRASMERGQKALSPAINTIYAIAHGLGLQFSYVASRAGLGDDADRWSNFSAAERLAVMVALGVGPEGQALDANEELDDSGGVTTLSELLDRRLRDLAKTIEEKSHGC
jgi:transcriptional regulator with XRE-family HTH domain